MRSIGRLKPFATNFSASRFSRFIFFGGLNTAITYLTYLILLQFTSYSIAYTVTFIQGIVIAYLFYSKYVFRSKLAIRQFAKYPLFYLIQYGASMLLLKIFVTEFCMSPVWAPAVIMALLAPPSYLMNKFILL